MAPPTIIDHAAGLTWVQDETMERGSHAIGDEHGIWLIDPVDESEPLTRAVAIGPVRGVIQLLDRHPRACAALAERYEVPCHRLPDELPGTPFDVITVLSVPRWRELALWWPERRALIVAETLGASSYFRLGAGPVGVHPFLRMLTPGALRNFEPDLLLFGHGPPVSGAEAGPGLKRAYRDARKDMLRAPLKLPELFRGG